MDDLKYAPQEQQSEDDEQFQQVLQIWHNYIIFEFKLLSVNFHDFSNYSSKFFYRSIKDLVSRIIGIISWYAFSAEYIQFEHTETKIATFIIKLSQIFLIF